MSPRTDPLFGRERWSVLAAMGASLGLSAALVAARVWRVHHIDYLFLLWNLFLAGVPLGAVAMARAAERAGARSLAAALLAVWLLFFPNAPYLVSDLVHLRGRGAVPGWYDAVLLMSCAWNGLLLGLLSLHDAQGLIARMAGRWWGRAFAAGAILASGFGVYLGRFSRWNSWDVVTHPGPLLWEIADRALHPTAHPRTWAVTVAFAAFVGVAYLSFAAFVRGVADEPSPPSPER